MNNSLDFLKSILCKDNVKCPTFLKNIATKQSAGKEFSNNIESRLDNRAKSCLDWLDENSGKDSHRTDFDSLFLSGYSMLKGSESVERLTHWTLRLSVVLLVCTFAMIAMAYLEIPEYPVTGQSVEPISSETYIDMGTYLVHESEYLIKLAKWNTPSDLNLELLTNVEFFSEIYDTRGYEFGQYVNSSNRSIQIDNPEMINPVLLHVTYAEKVLSPVEMQINLRLLPPNTNDSFYLLASSGEYDIKNAQINYDVINGTKLWMDTDDYDSWKNQTILIYENGVPIDKSTIDKDGKFVIEIKALNKWESKTYFIKKVGEDANE